MNRYNFTQNKFGKYDSIKLSDTVKGTSLEICLQGATILKFLIPINGNHFDIFDGFATPEEFEQTKGARCWIMAPFANRIPDGKYFFQDKLYQIDPIPPKTEVIHGFTSFEKFEVSEVNVTNSFAEVMLTTKKIRPNVFNGFPFALDISVKYKLEDLKVTVQVIADNVGIDAAPFGTGWHPYLKTSEKGIEHLILTIDAEELIQIDSSLIPLSGKKAYAEIDKFPNLDFRSSLAIDKRAINNRVLDNCFSKLKPYTEGNFKSSIFDPENGMQITMFQKGGVTLAYSGDTLMTRKRNSIALEPMQFITNAFNRDELKDKIKILPGEKSIFEFGVEVSQK
jgi:aldose 1-epimerase